MIEGNFIGTDVTGTKTLANVGDGVKYFDGSAAGVTIGGTVALAGNVIAGNTGNGVDVGDIDALVEGNFIGTNATGTRALPNGGDGVHSRQRRGGCLYPMTRSAEQQPRCRNIISGNAQYGVSIPGGDATADLVEGNFIGTDVTGTIRLGNGYSGVFISAQSNTIGGTAAGGAT